ncbi:MAG: hypothetical protein RQ862_11555 [Candidatus Caldarchaeales archaeon]|nr:hypothetical protein [Candidatus Caldarchaeales archaeon]
MWQVVKPLMNLVGRRLVREHSYSSFKHRKSFEYSPKVVLRHPAFLFR